MSDETNPHSERSEIEKLLSSMQKLEASDLHIKVASTPIYRVHGVPRRIKGEPFSKGKIAALVQSLISPEQNSTLEKEGSIDFGVGIAGVGRFRINVYAQRSSLSLCARRVNTEVPNFEELLLPDSINQVPEFHDGMALVVGVTGSGKSTTLAAIINRINSTRKAHILTIEDPIEYVYADDKSFINQREIGTDAPCFHTALRAALRQDPDVILIGELRDEETMDTALAAAETGHFVLGTLHATNCLQTVSRILEFFPPTRKESIRQVLSYTLRAVIAQRLLPGLKKEFPRVPAVEMMFGNAVIRTYIAEGNEADIPTALRNHAKDGMQDFNMSLFKLAAEGYVSEAAALERSSKPEQLAMQFKGMVLNSDQASMG